MQKILLLLLLLVQTCMRERTWNPSSDMKNYNMTWLSDYTLFYAESLHTWLSNIECVHGGYIARLKYYHWVAQTIIMLHAKYIITFTYYAYRQRSRYKHNYPTHWNYKTVTNYEDHLAGSLANSNVELLWSINKRLQRK